MKYSEWAVVGRESTPPNGPKNPGLLAESNLNYLDFRKKNKMGRTAYFQRPAWRLQQGNVSLGSLEKGEKLEFLFKVFMLFLGGFCDFGRNYRDSSGPKIEGLHPFSGWRNLKTDTNKYSACYISFSKRKKCADGFLWPNDTFQWAVTWLGKSDLFWLGRNY